MLFLPVEEDALNGRKVKTHNTFNEAVAINLDFFSTVSNERETF